MQNLTEQILVYSAKSNTEKSFDYTLPEYLPGISRIIKVFTAIEHCSFAGKISEQSNDVTMKISIVYSSEYDGKIKCAEFEESFSIPFVEELTYDGQYIAQPSCYVNSVHAVCRSQRNVSVKAALTSSAALYGKKNTQIYSPQEDSGICSRQKKLTAHTKKFLPEQQFEASAEISVPDGKAAISEIIHTEAICISNSTEISDGRLMFSADLNIKILYACAESDMQSTQYSYLDTGVSVNDVLHEESLTSDDKAFIYIDVCSVEPSLPLDVYGENRAVSFVIKYSLSGFMYQSKPLTLTTDAFIENSPAEPEYALLEYDTVGSHISKKETVSQVIHADMREISDICSCNIKIQSVATEQTKGQFFACAKCLATVVGTNASGELNSFDAPLTIHLPLGNHDLSDTNSFPDVLINICSCSAQIKDGALKLDITSDINGVFVSRERARVVSSLEVLPEQKTDKSNCEIIIYYPSKNESFWEIAKKYRINPDKICSPDTESGNLCKSHTIVIPK